MGFVTGCSRCGLVFTNPLVSGEELVQFYSPSGEWSRTHTATDVPPTDAEAGKKRRRGRGKWLQQFEVIRDDLRVDAPPRGARVFDYGCGTGQDLDVLQDCGWETWGLETAIDEAFTRHRRIHTVPDQPMFDLVIINHVLEHVTNPLGLLRQLARACRVGGYLLVGVPRFDTLPVHRDYHYVINGRAHVTAYTLDCLIGLLARAGFAPVSRDVAQPTPVRMRVLARRVDRPIPLPTSPDRSARGAIHAYYKEGEGRRLLARAGFIRLDARRRVAAGRAT